MANTRLPDNVHRLKGTFQPSRHGNPDEKPQLPEKAPSCPAWVGEEGRKKWRHLCRSLKGMGVLADIDQGLLLQYCTLWEKLVLTAKGEIVDEDGNRVWFTAADHAAMHRIGCELGIGAVSRSKIKISKPKEPPKPEGWDGL